MVIDNATAAILLGLLAFILFLAVQFRFIGDELLQRLTNVAGTVAAVAAILVFVIPAISDEPSPPTTPSIQLIEAAQSDTATPLPPDTLIAVVATDTPKPPAPTATSTATLIPTVISTNTPIPQIAAILPTPTFTPILIGQNCNRRASDIFFSLYQTYAYLLGCPVSGQITINTISEEAFQGGHLFWRKDQNIVYIIYDRQIGGNELFQGDWEKSKDEKKARYWDWGELGEPGPDGIGLSPPNGFVEPKRGFGWLWRTHLGRENGRLGWALDKAYGFDNIGQVQEFENGLMFRGSDPKVYALLNNDQFYASR